KMKFFFSFFFVISLIASSLSAQVGPHDLDFEGVKVNQDRNAQQWFLGKKEYMAHYQVQIVSGKAYKGNDCAEIESTGQPEDREFGNIMQFFDATPFIGKTVRYRAAVRVEGSGRAQLWMRVDRKEKQMGFFDNMDDRPINSSQW